MKVRFGALLGAALSLMASGAALAAEKVTVGMIADPGYHSAMWAILNGKVSDPNVEVTVDFMPIPAAHQAALSQQYDIMPNGTNAIPALAEQGLPVKVLGTVIRYLDGEDVVQPGLWALKDSPINGIEDLKGKNIAVQSVSAGDVVSRRAILQELYGYNIDAIGGDFNWIEIPGSQFEAALEAGRVDAAAFSNVKAYQISKSPNYKAVMKGGADLIKLYGAPLPAILFYTTRAEEKPEAIAAAAKLLSQSAAYLKANQEEIFADVAPKYNMDPADLRGWFNEFGEMPYSLTKADVEVMQKSWATAVKLGILSAAPANADDLIAPQAVWAD
jgi:ABC-type nitrate/sulfonate/bicarbonate transport system substrate-binding protein